MFVEKWRERTLGPMIPAAVRSARKSCRSLKAYLERSEGRVVVVGIAAKRHKPGLNVWRKRANPFSAPRADGIARNVIYSVVFMNAHGKPEVDHLAGYGALIL
jgi:hypothetical protein